MNDKQLEVWSIRAANERNPRDFWKHAGRAFVNQDGSINVLLDVLPIDGKLQIRKRRENELSDPGRGQGSSRPPEPTRDGASLHGSQEMTRDQTGVSQAHIH